MSQLEQMLLVLVVLGVAVIGVVVFLVVLVSRTRAGGELEEDEDEDEAPSTPAKPGADEGAPPPPPLGNRLKPSFRRALRRLESFAAGPRPRYQLPWYLMLGEADSHRPRLWQQAGLSLPFGPPEADSMSLEGLSWWFFDGGVVIDPAGDLVLRRDGHSSDERGYDRLLQQLQNSRPEKPLDGVILTISCRDLLLAESRGSQGIADLEQRAARVYRKLWKTQNQLCIRFPVYVLVTDSQEIPGFEGFCRELPEALADEIFGWSSDYNVETGYHGTWVDEAFAAIAARLHQAQTEVFATRPDIAGADSVFAFPGALETLRRPLAAYLDQIFKSSAYHESTLCRGIYFTGSDEAPGTAGDHSAGERPFRSFFVRELLERKIFPERGLARPTRLALGSRHRHVRYVQAALLLTALVLGLGVWSTWVARDRSHDIFAPLLNDIGTDLSAMRQQPRTYASVRESSQRLCDGMARIDVSHFHSAFLPASWLSDFDDRLKDAIREAFQEIIFKSLRLGLEDRAARLGRIVPAPPVAAKRDPLPVDRLPTFTELDDFIGEVGRFDQAVHAFNGLRSPGAQLEELAWLLDYLLQISLPQEFFDNSHLYAQALSAASLREFEGGETHSVWAREKAQYLEERFLTQLYEGNALTVALEDLGSRLERLGDDGGEQALRDAIAGIETAEDVLAHSETTWIFRQDLDLGPPFDDLVTAMGDTSYLGVPEAEDFRRAADHRWQGFRRSLLVARSRLTGPLLARDESRLERRLSGEVQILGAALADLLNQGFMGAETSKRIRPVPAGQRLLWDTLVLEQAAELQGPYERFRGRGLEPFPIEIRARLERTARQRLQQKIFELVSHAQVFEPLPRSITPLLTEPEIATEVTAFEAASQYLHQILGLFERLNLRQAYHDLSAILADQGFRLLAEIDEVLTEEELYTPLDGDFAWWDGEAPPAEAAFDVRDAEELEAYLDLQRGRLAHLATEYARPLITSLGKIGIQRQAERRGLYEKWERILRQLTDFENKKPGNSVAALEDLVRTDMGEVGLADCARALATKTPAGRARDFFLARRNRLQQQLFERCEGLAFEQALASYRAAEQLFNQRLAGRFPFSSELPQEIAAEADPDDVRAFFRDFDAWADGFRAVPNQLSNESTRAASRFVQQMRKVRSFFAVFLEESGEAGGAGGDSAAGGGAGGNGTAGKAAPAAPVFDFDVEFRTNQRHEAGANQIIGWRLEVGDQVLGLRDAERRGRWEIDQPVRLVLRWALNGERVPVLLSPRSGVWLEGREVIYEQRRRWSLLAFLQANPSAPEDFDALVDPRPHTLKFVVPTVPANETVPANDAADFDLTDPAAAGRLEETRVFIRLTLLAPDSKDPLLLPEFPDHAPPIMVPSGRESAAGRRATSSAAAGL